MNTFYFNTGVKPQNISNFPYDYHKKVGNVIRGGVLQCPFDCEAPINASLKYLCDNPDLDSAKCDGVEVFEIFNTSLVSKYAYFIVK